ncbi:MAG: hypothetical protein ACRC37_01460, partial [Lentisphaeria bacterium]
KIDKTMIESWYFLQYHIYALALHMHLELTLKDYNYESNFGGVIYLFVRGVNPNYGQDGVYYNKPEFELIKGLQEEVVKGKEYE